MACAIGLMRYNQCRSPISFRGMHTPTILMFLVYASPPGGFVRLTWIRRTALKELMSGNEAIARGAWEAGVTLAAGYPGTPSTEILENIVNYKADLHCEWAPNEKVALEVAVGASFAGARTIATMKHVGVNVAADPLMTFAMSGAVGGLVLVVADDPGMHSSQNEQDSRFWGPFAKIPVLEPSDSQEALDFVKYGLELSEKFETPVILRTLTRVSHSRSLVQTAERRAPNPVGFKKDAPRYVAIPAFARKMRVKVEQRLYRLTAESERSPLNRIEWGDKALGIVTSSVAYQYVKEIFPEASVFKLGMSYPYPESQLREFAAGVKELLVVEELDPLIENYLKANGIACRGRDLVPGIGELTPGLLAGIRAKLRQQEISQPQPMAQAADLPARPPVLCAGCPHRGTFTALKKFDVAVMGDIGCYSLGTLPPLSMLDSILCMGGSIGMAHGMQMVGEKRPVVGILGDSTFFHSGITGLLNTAYNKGVSTVVVVDNRITAMTGHQEHPGTGKTLEGEVTHEASIEDIGRACGVKRVRTLNPYHLKEMQAALEEELNAPEVSLLVVKAPCPLHVRNLVGTPRRIVEETCINCGACLKVGCPAIEHIKGQKPRINPLLCAGCSICAQTCPKKAIEVAK